MCHPSRWRRVGRSATFDGEAGRSVSGFSRAFQKTLITAAIFGYGLVLAARGFVADDGKCFGLFTYVAAFGFEGVFDFESQIEITDVDVLHVLVQGVEDIKLHVVKGLEKGLDEFALKLEQGRKFVLEKVVEVVEVLRCLLHFAFGFVEGFLVLEGLFFLVLQLLERGTFAIVIQLFVGALEGCFLDHFDYGEEFIRRSYDTGLNHF